MEGYAQRLIYPPITLDYYQGLIYVVVFSIIGVLAEGRKDVNLFGVVMLSLITALGGGTIRAVLLDLRVFWVRILIIRVLKVKPLILRGACSGAGTITAALRAVQEEAQSKLSDLRYTVPSAIGNILLTAWGPVIVAMMA